MLRNYLLTAFRIFHRQRAYSLINVIGLSIGLVTTFFITVYILDEISYDRFFKDADRIYRVGVFEKFDGTAIEYVESGNPLADALRREIPEVEDVVRVSMFRDFMLKYEDRSFFEQRFLLADSNFFHFFNFDLIEGNASMCLTGPRKIVLTERAALKYFDYHGDKVNSPIGKIMKLGSEDDWDTAEVTGIMKDVPGNTHMQFDMILSMESWQFARENQRWNKYELKNYFKIRDNNSLPAVMAKLDYFMQHYQLPQLEKELHISTKDMASRGDEMHFIIQPLTSIHLRSNGNGEFGPNGDIRYVYIFGAVALFIILIACVNFVNLATARALQRAKEVGIRKIVGAKRGWLIRQFMLESFFYVALSAVLAVIFFALLIDSFNILAEKDIRLSMLATPQFAAGLGVILVLAALLAGSYPAFFLTSFKPLAVLKGGSSGRPQNGLKHTLVIFQFAISMSLIISTLVIYKQLQLIQQQNLGFDRANLVTIPRTLNLGSNADAFKIELLRHPEFASAAYGIEFPPHVASTGFAESKKSDQLIAVFYMAGDHDLAQTIGFELKAGRYFSREHPGDSAVAVINEACAALVGIKEPGEWLGVGGGNKMEIIGIVKDFNFENPRGKVGPLVINVVNFPLQMVARIQPGRTADALAIAGQTWKKLAPGMQFEYSFVDQELRDVFRAEQRMGLIFQIFTGMSIFVACLGLFGLVTLTAAQRAREMSIRKVLGASTSRIVILLSGTLIRLVAISFVISVPTAWYAIDQWLQGFAHRTEFDWMIVLEAGAAGIIACMLTVAYRSIKAASANPVTALRSE